MYLASCAGSDAGDSEISLFGDAKSEREAGAGSSQGAGGLEQEVGRGSGQAGPSQHGQGCFHLSPSMGPGDGQMGHSMGAGNGQMDSPAGSATPSSWSPRLMHGTTQVRCMGVHGCDA